MPTLCSFFSWQGKQKKRRTSDEVRLFVLALPIFPVRLQTSIFGAGELNFRVRDGNGWTLTAINTNYFPLKKKVSKENFKTFPSLPSFSTASILSNFSRTVKYFLDALYESLVTRTGFEPMLTA